MNKINIEFLQNFYLSTRYKIVDRIWFTSIAILKGKAIIGWQMLFNNLNYKFYLFR